VQIARKRGASSALDSGKDQCATIGCDSRMLRVTNRHLYNHAVMILCPAIDCYEVGKLGLNGHVRIVLHDTHISTIQ
jgi:hypothetical protein